MPYTSSNFGTQEFGQFCSPFQSKFAQYRITFQERGTGREKKRDRLRETDRQTVRGQGEQILKTEGSSREPYSKFHQ